MGWRMSMGAIAITVAAGGAGCESISEDGTEWIATPGWEVSASESAQNELADHEIGSTRQALTGTHKACQCAMSGGGGAPGPFHSIVVNDGWTRLACSNYCATKVAGATHGRLSCISSTGFVNAAQSFVAGSSPLPPPSPQSPAVICGW